MEEQNEITTIRVSQNLLQTLNIIKYKTNKKSIEEVIMMLIQTCQQIENSNTKEENLDAVKSDVPSSLYSKNKTKGEGQ